MLAVPFSEQHRAGSSGILCFYNRLPHALLPAENNLATVDPVTGVTSNIIRQGKASLPRSARVGWRPYEVV
jgi:hypothetical protein